MPAKKRATKSRRHQALAPSPQDQPAMDGPLLRHPIEGIATSRVSEIAEPALSRVSEPSLCWVGGLPPELLITVFSFLDTLQLIRSLGVCRYWRNTLSNNTALWPSYISVRKGGGYAGLEEYFRVDGIRVLHPKLVRSLCEKLSNLGNVKVLNMTNHTLKGETETFGVPFFKSFPSLEILYLSGFTISIEDLAAILDTFCQALRSLYLSVYGYYEFGYAPDRNIILSRPTALCELSIQSDQLPLFTYSLVSQSPDLTRLRLPSFDFDPSEVTRCFEKLEHLELDVGERLPRLGCMNLKSLCLHIEGIFIDDGTADLYIAFIFEDGEAGDLSSIRCLEISTEHILSQNQVISVMRSYNIGRNLEGLILCSIYEPVRIHWADICSQAPILRTLTTLVDQSTVSDSELMRKSMSHETQRELEARGVSVTVTHWNWFDGEICKVCKEVHLGSVATNLPLSSYLDEARSLN
jgi:hypothetical protein